MMDGYDEKKSLNEDDFGAKGGIVSAFDAFPKSKPQYVQRTAGGGKWTVVMSVIAFYLFCTEFGRYWRGSENHTFAVEKGIGHELQVNLDVVVKMQCSDLHINVQDAAGDRILAADRLRRDSTTWDRWVNTNTGLHKLMHDAGGRIDTFSGYHIDEGFGEEHVHDIVAISKRKAKWAKTPTLRGEPDSCRVYGSMDLNKVQGDFHITARGHGYVEFGEHLDHTTFNFSHVINEFSFGAFYPSLSNPLDRTINLADDNFHKFQYYLSVVPTVYTVGRKRSARHTVFTNQFAVTEQSKAVDDHYVPGIFVKYDIEPVLLLVEETRPGFLQFLLKVVNVLSGVVVAFHWGFTLTSWAREVWGKRKRSTQGFIGNKSDHDE